MCSLWLRGVMILKPLSHSCLSLQKHGVGEVRSGLVSDRGSIFLLPRVESSSRREVRPKIGFGVVLRDALALTVHASKNELRVRIALFCRFAKPDCGLHIVLGYAVAFCVKRAKLELCEQIGRAHV